MTPDRLKIEQMEEENTVLFRSESLKQLLFA